MDYEKLDLHLTRLVDALIAEATNSGLVREGVVMTVGPTPYRRLDCDGRALAYIRKRPKKRAVRIDVPGLWSTPPSAELSMPASAGRALLVRTEAELAQAVAFLIETVDRTRRRVPAGRERVDAAA